MITKIFDLYRGGENTIINKVEKKGKMRISKLIRRRSLI
jgi:hypothetical protein